MTETCGVRVEKGAASGIFTLASWDEDTYMELEGEAKLTRAAVEQTFAGDIDGKGSVTWLMCYGHDGTATFVGLQHVDGTFTDRRGSFVLETTGLFDGERAKGDWRVVPGSGTGELTRLSGEGGFEAPHGSEATFTLDYRLQ